MAQEREAQLMADVTPEAYRSIAQADPKAQEDVARFERMMRENPTEYWKPANQEAYRDAIQRSLVEAPTLPPGPAAPIAAPLDRDAAPAPAAPAGMTVADRSAVWQSVTVSGPRQD